MNRQVVFPQRRVLVDYLFNALDRMDPAEMSITMFRGPLDEVRSSVFRLIQFYTVNFRYLIDDGQTRLSAIDDSVTGMTVYSRCDPDFLYPKFADYNTIVGEGLAGFSISYWSQWNQARKTDDNGQERRKDFRVKLFSRLSGRRSQQIMELGLADVVSLENSDLHYDLLR